MRRHFTITYVDDRGSEAITDLYVGREDAKKLGASLDPVRFLTALRARAGMGKNGCHVLVETITYKDVLFDLAAKGLVLLAVFLVGLILGGFIR